MQINYLSIVERRPIAKDFRQLPAVLDQCFDVLHDLAPRGSQRKIGPSSPEAKRPPAGPLKKSRPAEVPAADVRWRWPLFSRPAHTLEILDWPSLLRQFVCRSH